MASFAVAATRSLIRCGSTRASYTVPRNCSSSCRPGGFAALGKGMMMRHSTVGQPDRRASSFRAFSSAVTESSSETIQVGEKLPEAELSYLDKDDNVQTIKVSELTEGKKVVLFAVPAAFSPTCSSKHVPAFITNADELKARGIDTIACVSVNDVFVLRAWGNSIGVGEKVLMLSDGNVKLTKALGVQMDMAAIGGGLRSRRYSLLADNGVVKQFNLEEGGGFTISGPQEILKAL